MGGRLQAGGEADGAMRKRARRAGWRGRAIRFRMTTYDNLFKTWIDRNVVPVRARLAGNVASFPPVFQTRLPWSAASHGARASWPLKRGRSVYDQFVLKPTVEL